MTVAELKKWLDSLPPECDNAVVLSDGAGISIHGRDRHGAFTDWMATGGFRDRPRLVRERRRGGSDGE
jgi:hypothetical protein